MSDSYTKLFSSITDSTIWREPDHVRIVWITMLAMADRDGCIWASVPGLADRARKSIEETQDALRRFMAPDEWSRTKDHDGRRIEEIDGGWSLLNHAKFREIRSAEDRKEYKKQWDQGHRPSGHARSQSDTVRQSPTQSDNSDKSPTSPTPPDTTPTPTPDQKQHKSGSQEYLPACIDPALWADFEKHRSEIRKPLKPQGRKQALLRLQTMYARGLDPNQALRDSIANGWSGVFEPKTKPSLPSQARKELA